jgi:hypothetical protein
MVAPLTAGVSRPGTSQAATPGRADPSLLPSAYDLLAWLQHEEDHLEANPGRNEPLRRSLVTVLAHIAGTYWLDPADEGMELRPGAQPSHHSKARP